MYSRFKYTAQCRNNICLTLVYIHGTLYSSILFLRHVVFTESYVDNVEKSMLNCAHSDIRTQSDSMEIHV